MQWSTGPIDGLLVNPRTVDGIRNPGSTSRRPPEAPLLPRTTRNRASRSPAQSRIPSPHPVVLLRLSLMLLYPRAEPVPNVSDPNKWCVTGQYQIYNNGMILNKNRKMAKTNTEERMVLTRSLHTVPIIEELFRRHKCEWMARSPCKYNEEMTKEFYAFTIRNSISKRAKPVAQPPL
uniref:Uncharacterized protein n=1 Tax=Solanum tuberosum TaxID=4113 RepID=M1E0Q6_SOLTU